MPIMRERQSNLLEVVRRWGPLLATFLAAVASAGAVWGATRGNVTELQDKVQKLEQAHNSDHELLERIDRRVAFIAGRMNSRKMMSSDDDDGQ